MKYIPFLLILALGIISCKENYELEVNCVPTHLHNGVIAYYPFINGSLDDESAQSNNLTNTTNAAPTTDRNGNANCAYRFDNSQTDEEFLTTSNTGFLNRLDEFSISIWFESIDTSRDGAIYEVLLGRGDEGRCPNRRGEWSIGLYDCRRPVFGHNNSVWAKPILGDPIYECEKEVIAWTGAWHHVVVIRDGEESKIYVNGNLEQSRSGNGGCPNLHLAEDVGDLFIGSYYTGKIDDILIYNRELSQAEVSELYALAPCCQ